MDSTERNVSGIPVTHGENAPVEQGTQISPDTLERLVRIETHVHYGQAPPPGVEPFVVIERDSSILLSAPHGARTFRNNLNELWHEEDEYTAGMALLLGEICGTSVIATTWRTDDCDPNEHGESRCKYKQAMRHLVGSRGIRWVLDLHGAAENGKDWLVDVGTRKHKLSLAAPHCDTLCELLERYHGPDTVSRDAFAALDANRITAFAQEELGIQAVQLEMKPSVRVKSRRTDASAFAKSVPFDAPDEKVIGMMQALTDFIGYLEHLP